MIACTNLESVNMNGFSYAKGFNHSTSKITSKNHLAYGPVPAT